MRRNPDMVLKRLRTDAAAESQQHWKLPRDRRREPEVFDGFVCVLLQSSLTLPDPMGCSPQAPLSTGFSRQEYWSGLPRPPPGDLHEPGIKPMVLMSSAGSLPLEPPGNPTDGFNNYFIAMLGGIQVAENWRANQKSGKRNRKCNFLLSRSLVIQRWKRVSLRCGAV